MIEIDYARVCEQLMEAVRDAGRIILEQWKNPREITHKGRIDIVTQTDLAVEETLRKSLAAILPQAGFLAEESAGQPDRASLSDLCWVVDPLDGTVNYAHSLPIIAVSVGLWHKGAIRAGVVFNPLLEEMFHAVEGQGAFLNGEPIHVSQTTELKDCVVATGFPYTIRERVDEVLGWMRRVLFQCQGVRRFGAAAVDLAYVACGRLDGFYEAGLKPWDSAAGWLLVLEAGGRVSRYQAGQAFDLFAPDMLAANEGIHQALSDTILGK